MPASEIPKHDIALIHTCKNWWSNGSSSLNSLLKDIASRLSILLFPYCCLWGRDELIPLIGKGVATEPEFSCAILLGEVD